MYVLGVAHADLIRKHYASLSSPSPEAVSALADSLDPEYELHEFQAGPDPTVYHGREGFLAWVRQGLEVFDEPRFEPLELVEDGDTVFVSVQVRFVGRESRVPVEMIVYHVWEMRKGRPWRVRGFLDQTEARRASGPASKNYTSPA